MRPGQLDLVLDYPSCMANAIDCERLSCPYSMGSKAKVRCSMAVATVSGALEAQEIAELTGEDVHAVQKLLRSALRKAGPRLAVIHGRAFDPDKRVCPICKVTEVATVRTPCSDACRAAARRRSWQKYNERAKSRPRWKTLAELAARWLVKIDRRAA
jgi:hypothetical protein